MNSEIEEARASMREMSRDQLFNWIKHLENETKTPVRTGIIKALKKELLLAGSKIPAKGCKNPGIPPSWGDCSDGDRI